MLENLGGHSPHGLALRMHALAQNVLDLRIAKRRELDTEVRRVKRPILRLVLGEESAFQMNAVATRAAEHMDQPLAVRAHCRRVGDLRPVKRDLSDAEGTLRPLLTTGNNEQKSAAPFAHLLISPA